MKLLHGGQQTMKNGVLIKNGRVIDPANRIDGKRDVLIIDGNIEQVSEKIDGEGLGASDINVIDAGGKLVTPGLIDIHVHFREPGVRGRDHSERLGGGGRSRFYLCCLHAQYQATD